MVVRRTSHTRIGGRCTRLGGSRTRKLTARPLSALLRQEDELLRQLILEYGPKNWSIIANGIRGRSGKSCRLRCAGGSGCSCGSVRGRSRPLWALLLGAAALASLALPPK